MDDLALEKPTPMEAAQRAVCLEQHAGDPGCFRPGGCDNCRRMASRVIRAYNDAMLTKEPICAIVTRI